MPIALAASVEITGLASAHADKEIAGPAICRLDYPAPTGRHLVLNCAFTTKDKPQMTGDTERGVMAPHGASLQDTCAANKFTSLPTVQAGLAQTVR